MRIEINQGTFEKPVYDLDNRMGEMLPLGSTMSKLLEDILNRMPKELQEEIRKEIKC